MLSKSQFSIGPIQYVPWTLYIFWTFPTSEREMFGISPQNFWNCFFKAAIFMYRRTFSAKVSIWKENYAFCHFSTLVKKSRAFQGKLSAWLSKLPSTYVNNSLFWGERRFPKIFLYHFRVRAENVLIFSEVVFWTVVETATYISSAPFWGLFWKFFFSDLLCLWATNVRKFGAIKSDQLSNCLLRVQTSIPRWNWYLEKNFYFFMTFGPQA